MWLEDFKNTNASFDSACQLDSSSISLLIPCQISVLGRSSPTQFFSIKEYLYIIHFYLAIVGKGLNRQSACLMLTLLDFSCED